MQQLDRCDALDLLEEAELTRREITITLEGGRRVSGRVIEVANVQGGEEVVLEDGARVPVGSIVAIDR